VSAPVDDVANAGPRGSAGRSRALPTADELRAQGARVERWGSWYAAEHMLLTLRAWFFSVLIAGLGSPILYLLAMGLGLATLIDSDAAQGPHGPVPYVQFLAPALLATAVLQAAFEECSFPVMGGFKWRLHFWALHATPVNPRQIATGAAVTASARMLMNAVLFYAVMLVFGVVPDLATGWLTMVAGMLGGWAFGLPVMAYTATLRDDAGQLTVLMRCVFTPMFLFSGTFYPLAATPVWLQPIGWVSPLWHASELGRAASYGTTDPGWLVALRLGYLVALGGLGLWLARRAFVRRMAL